MPNITLRLSLHAVVCPELANPGNGTVTISDSILVSLGLGSKASYSCDPGYTLVGDEVHFCVLSAGAIVATGVWNGSTLTNCQGTNQECTIHVAS